jgi:SAM-dependent methyltransferase
MESPGAAPQKFDAYADDYDKLHAASIADSGESTEYFAEYKLRRLLRLGAPRNEPILDFGSGIGNLTEKLVLEFSDVTAFDPSEKSREIGGKRVPRARQVGSEDELEDGHFASAVLSGVLHHVPVVERRELLARVRRKLRPGGRVFVFEHNPLNPLTQRAVKRCAFDDDAVLLWPWSLRPLLENAGFSPVRVDYIVFFPRAFAALRPVEPYLRHVFMGAQTLTVGANPP